MKLGQTCTFDMNPIRLYNPGMGKLLEKERARALSKRRLNHLKNERRKLTARMQKLDAQLAKLGKSRQPGRLPTPQDLEHWFDELGQGMPPVSPLPAGFSRADIYDDHD